MRFKLKISTISLLLLIFFASSFSTAASEVIVHKSSPAPRIMTRNELTDVFTLNNTHWANGVPIKLFVLPRHSIISKDFAYNVLRMPSSMYFDILDYKQASGKEKSVMFFENEQSVLINLTLTEGSIGYIYHADIIDSFYDLRVIKIIDEVSAQPKK
jgi:hypothetical protein